MKTETRKILAAKVDAEYHAKSHAAADALGTTVAAIIKKAMDRTINRASKKGASL